MTKTEHTITIIESSALIEPIDLTINLTLQNGDLDFHFEHVHQIAENWGMLHCCGLNQSTLFDAYNRVCYDVHFSRKKR